MTELITTLRPTSETDPSPSPAPAPSPAVDEPTLITEQQVMFSTAAAVALPAAKSRRWTGMIGAVRGAVHALFVSPQKPVRGDVPKRYSYLENALMAREMHRL